jgi:hypothetical protein
MSFYAVVKRPGPEVLGFPDTEGENSYGNYK